MQLRIATKKEIRDALKIAKTLKEWFNEEGIKNMKTDFNLNNLLVAVERNKVVGFLCYSSYSGKMQLIWIGVVSEFQSKSIGKC